MWNVLLVEDEVFVRRSLKQLIRWEDMGFTISNEAGDGQEALEMMRADPPDLVVSDIIMPGMDGLELMKQARAEGLDASFVMLTCMNEFEYARQALEYGASAYLLKLSMNVQSLEETLTKVKRELAHNLNVRSQTMAQPFHRLYQETWQSIHKAGGTVCSPKLQQTLLEDVGLLRKDGRTESIWIGAFLHGSTPFTLDDFQQLGIVTQGNRSIVHTFAHSGQTTVFVWNPEAFRPWPEEKGTFPWIAACSSVEAGVEMPSAWNRVLRTLDRAWYEGRPGLDQAAAASPVPSSSEPLAWRTERELIHSFELRKLDEFKLRLKTGWEEAWERSLPMAVVKEMALRVDRLLSRIAGCSATAEEELLHCMSHAELGERLLASAERYANRNIAAAQPLTGHREIDKAMAYVHQHYASDISLRAVAALVAMDEGYFSGLFKKKTGVTLIHYIQQVRINHAKGLLEQTKLPVIEIGERVGFPNANYFIKIFKRWTGQTPSEYRTVESK